MEGSSSAAQIWLFFISVSLQCSWIERHVQQAWGSCQNLSRSKTCILNAARGYGLGGLALDRSGGDARSATFPASRAARLHRISMADRITIRKPDDWHLHVRDNEMLRATLPFTARHFGRAILMPNLIPPVRTTADAVAYRERVMAALPQGSTFKPLLTCYLTDDTDPEDVERGFREGVFTGVKLYPANATTNSAAGVTDYR